MRVIRPCGMPVAFIESNYYASLDTTPDLPDSSDDGVQLWRAPHADSPAASADGDTPARVHRRARHAGSGHGDQYASAHNGKHRELHGADGLASLLRAGGGDARLAGTAHWQHN